MMVRSTIISWLNPRNFLLLTLLLLLTLHIPFMHADADREVSWSRGPYIDEGLYTSQIRNALNHGKLDISETDGLLKAPLFNAMLYPVFAIAGTDLIVSRTFVLLFTLLTFLTAFRLRSMHWAVLFSALMLLTQFLLFHHSHLGLAEMPVACFIMLAMIAYVKSREEKTNKRALRYIFISCLFCALAYSTKIIALYAAVLVPTSLLITAISQLILRERQKAKSTFVHFIYAGAFTLFFLLLFWLCWYFPNRDLFRLVLDTQTEISFSQGALWQQVMNNFRGLFYDPALQHYLILFFCSLILLLILFIKKPGFLRTSTGAAIIFCLVWLLLEVPKLGFNYLPSRYLVSAIFPLTLFTSLVLQLLKNEYPLAGKFSYVLLLLFTIHNLVFYTDAMERRTWQVKAINDYLGQYEFGERPVMGNWGAAANWKCKAVSKPVAKNYFNDKNILSTFHPRVIIAEPGEEKDPGNAFHDVSNDLHSISDSSRTFKIGNWKPTVYWLHIN